MIFKDYVRLEWNETYSGNLEMNKQNIFSKVKTQTHQTYSNKMSELSCGSEQNYLE